VKIPSLDGEDALLLQGFEGFERVSTPYRYILHVRSDKADLDLKSLLQKPAVITFAVVDGSERFIHGNINRCRLLEDLGEGVFLYEIEIVPWLWYLGLFADCRIFQNKSVIDIVKKVFADRGYTDYKDQTTGTYPPRDYCIQYRETDLNFISRLMEDEGIFYFFEQTAEKHIMVIADQQSAFVTCPKAHTVRFHQPQAAVLEEDTIGSLGIEVRVETGKASLTDYDFEKPNTSLSSTISGDGVGEVYDHPGNYKTKGEGDRYSRVRLEEREVRSSTLHGGGNAMGMECGFKFTLAEHNRDDLNVEYAITALHQKVENTPDISGEASFQYKNDFEAIPSSVPFRPPRTAKKPMVPGSQTAVVVGKSGEEIWVDQYGRIKVQFVWDREGKVDENSSCWIRVGQFWAGKKWGAIFTPRIGQEVIVTFLEGDPDRPLVTGSVYNADQMPPYALPGEQTKSTIKSMSSKGGDGFNEFRFEDKKGSEQIFIHGEKELDVRIKNDRKEWIGRDRSLIVKRDKFEKVERDEHIDITRDQVEKIGRDHHVEVAGKAAVKITGSNSLSVTGDVIEEFKANHSSQVTQNLYLKALQVVIEASTGITLKVGGNFITIDPSGVAIKGILVQINSGGAALSGSPGSLVSPLSPTAAVEADKADPGAVTQAPQATQVKPGKLALTSVAATLAAAAGNPVPFAVAAAAAVRQSAASDAPTHDPNSEENQDKTHWIEIEFQDEAGQPITGEPYRITLPDGTTVADGTLDEKGRARVANIDPGTCKVTFPNLDKEAWKVK